METVLDVLRKTEAFLASKGIERAKIDAEWLVAHGLKVQRLQLFLQHDRPLAEADLAAIRPLVMRRAKREPLAYILGEQPFMGLHLRADRRALIPRPETEELVELVHRQCPEPPQRVLDLGTGTGALALALAQLWPTATVVATDASSDALGLAQENAARNGLADRVSFLHGPWWSPVEGTFDLIVSNPPYVTEADWAETAPEVRQWEPKSALIAADEGLADLRSILAGARKHLSPSGLLALEAGLGQPEVLAAEALALGFPSANTHRDITRRPRFLLARNG